MIIYILAAISLLLLLYFIVLMPGQLPPFADDRLRHCKYAHRGLHKKDKSVPENSLPAFMQAVESGYGIELDVTLTADGQVVVFHDDSLLRVCGADKKIAECSYGELLFYRLCGTDERIPSFSEVLQVVSGRVPLLVELKHSKQNDLLCRKTAALLDAYQGPYCIESFHPGIVRWFYKNRPHVVRGQLSGGRKSFSGIPSWQGAVLSALLTNAVNRPHFVAYKHQDAHHRLNLGVFRLLGGLLFGWTVRDTDDIQACIKRFDCIIFEFFKP